MDPRAARARPANQDYAPAMALGQDARRYAHGDAAEAEDAHGEADQEGVVVETLGEQG